MHETKKQLPNKSGQRNTIEIGMLAFLQGLSG